MTSQRVLTRPVIDTSTVNDRAADAGRGLTAVGSR